MIWVWIVVGIVFVLAVVMVFGGGSCSSQPTCHPATDEEIRNLARQGRKIDAIKEYRALHGVGLKEAKDAVDQMK